MPPTPRELQIQRALAGAEDHLDPGSPREAQVTDALDGEVCGSTQFRYSFGGAGAVSICTRCGAVYKSQPGHCTKSRFAEVEA